MSPAGLGMAMVRRGGPVAIPARRSASSVQIDRGPDERLERLRVELLTLADVDRPARVPLEARVEEPGRIVQGRALEEGQLDHGPVRLAGADEPVVRPDRRARAARLGPFPLLDHVRVGLLDEPAERGERLAPPVAELGDTLIDLLRCSGAVHGREGSEAQRLTRKCTWVTPPSPSRTRVRSSSICSAGRPSNRRRPWPKSTGTTWSSSSSSTPAASASRATPAPWTRTSLSPAASFARAIAVAMSSTKLMSGHCRTSAGGSPRLTMKIGTASWWSPCQ